MVPLLYPLLKAEYDNMLRCIRCAQCLSVCPTYQVTFFEEEAPRGRIALIRAYTEGHLGITPDLLRHLERCLLCEACTAICPAGVQMDPLGLAFRATLLQQREAAMSHRLLRATILSLVKDIPRLARAVSLLRLAQRRGLQSLALHSGLLELLGLQAGAQLLPMLWEQPLLPLGQQWAATGEETEGSVALFTGCIMSVLLAATHQATIRLLTARGWSVEATKGQGCCGALHAHQGRLEEAKELARRNIDAFEETSVTALVVNAAGCGAMLKSYPHLLRDDEDYAQRASRFAAKVRDLSEVLAPLPTLKPLAEWPIVVTYQDACHLAHAQGIREAPRQLLRAIPGLRLVEMEEAALCCGSAGLYNLLQSQMAQGLLERKLRQIVATGASVVVSANPGCILQLQAGLRAQRLPIRVAHLAEFLGEAYRREIPATATVASG